MYKNYNFIYSLLCCFSFFLCLDPSDYTTTTETIFFTSGQTLGSTVDISIPIINDNIAETLESFFGGLSQISTNLAVTVAPTESQIFIYDDGDRKN